MCTQPRKAFKTNKVDPTPPVLTVNGPYEYSAPPCTGHENTQAGTIEGIRKRGGRKAATVSPPLFVVDADLSLRG